MKQKKLSREEIIEQWLDLYPVQQIAHDKENGGTVVLVIPHTENWFTRRFLPKVKNPAQRIRLDAMGSFVWNHFDGKNSVREIGKKLHQEFGEQLSAAEERTVLFCQHLYKQHFIAVFEKKERTDPAGSFQSPPANGDKQ